MPKGGGTLTMTHIDFRRATRPDLYLCQAAEQQKLSFCSVVPAERGQSIRRFGLPSTTDRPPTTRQTLPTRLRDRTKFERAYSRSQSPPLPRGVLTLCRAQASPTAKSCATRGRGSRQSSPLTSHPQCGNTRPGDESERRHEACVSRVDNDDGSPVPEHLRMHPACGS